MTSDLDELAEQIAEPIGPMSERARLQLTQRISEALKTERERFDEKTNETLQLFGEHQMKMIADAYENYFRF